jgi:cellulose synthase/poly-beta-1,6-N-acetylglucosamine synthase-like glycosyltransferase
MLLTLFTALYVLCAILLTLYASGEIILLIAYWRYRHRQLPIPDVRQWPTVVIQLPIYNERYVVERLLNAIAALARQVVCPTPG